jgi:hypothetical protein
VWNVNEELTKRTRPVLGPFMLFIAPWGDNGWLRVNTSSSNGRYNAEYQLATWDGKVYSIFGTDPRETTVNKPNDFTIETRGIRNGVVGDKAVVSFSRDCKRLTSTTPSGVRPDGTRYENDVRIYDKVDPAAAAASPIYGLWKLDQQASKLTAPPMGAQVVALIPHGKAGWARIAIAGAYQPDDLKSGVKPTPGARTDRFSYWATWDGKVTPSYGNDPRDVSLKKIDDHNFEMSFMRDHQPVVQGNKTMIAFSADGKHMTETTKAGLLADGKTFADDVRVYEKIEEANWPGEVRALPPAQ